MSLGASEIAAVVAELAPLLRSRVDAVRMHAERALTLELFGPAGAATLLVSAEADLTRLHVVERRPRRPAAGERPAPHPFQALLRRELEGARLSRVEARAGDRVVELSFIGDGGAGESPAPPYPPLTSGQPPPAGPALATRTPARELPAHQSPPLTSGQPPPAGPALATRTPARELRLVAELTGRHGNLFLVGPEGVIVASAGRNLSQRRELAPGKPYVPPAERPSKAPPCAAEGGDRGPASPRASGGEGEGRSRFPLSAVIEERYRQLEQERAALEGRRRLREPVRAAVARARRALEKLAEEAARVPAAEGDRRRADLLKQNLHAIPRGAREALLTEWTAEGPREARVALDPALPPRENMERYYRRYRRIVESAARVAARSREVSGRQAELLALLDAVDRAELDELPRLEREARRLGAAPRPPPRPRSKRDEPLPPYRLFRSVAGIALLVGRGAEANDALTVRVARGNDLWLHARGRHGAHVVAKLAKGRLADGETLLDAAHLAAHFSDARGEPQVEVVATRAKYVRKVKGAAPGTVTYSQERTILLRVEPPRVERLLASEDCSP